MMEAAELETVSQSEEVLPAVKHVGATGTELLFFTGLATSELVKMQLLLATIAIHFCTTMYMAEI